MPPDMLPETGLVLTLNGPPAIGRAGAGACALERKDAAWLATIALDGATARDRLLAWFWPDAAAKTAAGSLRQRIFRLRQRVGHDVVRAAERVELLPDVRLADADGELLAGYEYPDCSDFSDWLSRQRDLQRERRIEQLTARAAAHEAGSELHAALELTHRLLALEPASEHAQRRLMRLHYLRGDRAAAIAAYERFERLLKTEFDTRPGQETREMLAVIQSASQAPAAPRAPVPLVLQRPPRTVGREQERAELASAWAAGRVFWLLGEAGMGKTRVLADLAGARTGATVMVAARPGDAGVPFALLARLLRAVRALGLEPETDDSTRRELARVLPELAGCGDAGGGGQGQLLMLQRAVEGLLSGLTDHAILVDDLHYADAASAEMLTALLCSERLQPPLWGLAQRPTEGCAELQALHGALAEAQRLHELPLAPLDEAAIADLLQCLALHGLGAQAPALVPALVRHTGGNPLFVLETLKDLVLRGGAGGKLPKPASVNALIDRRLKALSPKALALARVAAVAGVDFDIELAQAVLREGALALADPWAELQSAQILAGTGFAHDLVFESVRRTLPEAIAQHVHASVAAWLHERGAEPARTAAHWFAAGRWQSAAAAYATASKSARHAGRIVEALALHDQATHCFAQAGDPAATWQQELEGVELTMIGRGPALAAELARRLAASAPDSASLARALAHEAMTMLIASRWAEAVPVVERALAMTGADAGLDDRLRAERVHAMVIANVGRAAEGTRRLQALQAEVDLAGTARQRFEHRSALSYTLNLEGRIGATAQALRETIALAEQAGDTMEVMQSLGNLAATEVLAGRSAAAQQSQRTALSMRQRTGVDGGAFILPFEMNLGLIAVQLGEYAEALERLEPAPARMSAMGPVWAGTAAVHLAALWIVLGQPHRAASALAAAPPSEHPTVVLRHATLQARLARLGGKPRPDVLAPVLERFSASLPFRNRGPAALELSRVMDPQRALTLLREVRRAALEAEMAGIALHALTREVDVLLDVDPGHAVVLAAELERRDPAITPTDLYIPEIDWVLSRVAAAARDDAARERWQTAARGWIERAAAGLPAGLRGPFLRGNPVNAALWRRSPSRSR
jgi:DNA-binding SARP family transcriptional activator/tetratricopeptide (TPR) repeat protein